jgi:predicted Holliday junction resolvase-like endonuclease
MNYEILGLVLAAIIMIMGGIATLYKLSSSIRKERDEENAKVLKESKEYTDSKYKVLEQELKYHKEIHEGKVAELSDKIEQLREEMRRHHGQLVDLLTKMVEKE